MNKKVLIVEYNDDLRKNLTSDLERHGLIVDNVKEYDVSMKIASSKEDYGILFCSTYMGIDSDNPHGVNIASEFHDNNPNSPIIAMSGHEPYKVLWDKSGLPHEFYMKKDILHPTNIEKILRTHKFI